MSTFRTHCQTRKGYYKCIFSDSFNLFNAFFQSAHLRVHTKTPKIKARVAKGVDPCWTGVREVTGGRYQRIANLQLVNFWDSLGDRNQPRSQLSQVSLLESGDCFWVCVCVCFFISSLMGLFSSICLGNYAVSVCKKVSPSPPPKAQSIKRNACVCLSSPRSHCHKQKMFCHPQLVIACWWRDCCVCFRPAVVVFERGNLG